MDGQEPKARVPTEPPWGVLDGIAIFIVWACVQALVVSFLGARKQTLAPQMAGVLVGGLVILAVIAVFLHVRVRGKRSAPALLGIRMPDWPAVRRALPPLALGIAAYVAVDYGWGAVLQFSGLSAKVRLQELVSLVVHSRSTGALVLAFAGASIVAPVAEETIFRSLLYLPLRRSLGVTAAACLVSAAFAFAHRYGWGFPQFFVLSLTFVALFERTGTLVASMAAHSAYNTVNLILLLWMMSHGGPAGP